MFLIYGRRFGEIITLEWNDINFEDNNKSYK